MLRIIGGTWRGRRWRFPPLAGIRPTPDRVRETLFNWLSARVPGARCLDLFAGSGALGLEALSRGASHVTFVECDGEATRAIEECLCRWDPARRHDWRVVEAKAASFFRGPAKPFDIVFLDPPFDSGLLTAVFTEFQVGGWLAADARIYVECPAGSLPAVPPGWASVRSGKAGEVGYHLYLRQRGTAAE